MESIGLKAVMDITDLEAGARAYDSAINQMIGAGDDLSSSAKSQLTSLTDLAEVLSNGGPAKLAATSISQLKQQFMDGSITAEQYASAVTQVQDEFGLVSPTGKAAAGALTSLNAAFAAGEISAEEYAQGLKAVDVGQDDAGDSAVDLAARMEIVEKVYGQIKDTIGQAVELAELGSQTQRAEKQFRAFAGEVGDADELLAAFQRGAGGTADKMTAMSSAGRLLQMGLVKDADQMELVVEIASRLGNQTLSVSDRISDFALLLANSSVPRLDNFGVSAGAVRARIKELQEQTAGMDRQTAFMIATLEEGRKSLGILGERVEDDGMKMERARAKIADMRAEMGQRLLPIVAQVFGMIENLNMGTMALIATLGMGAGILVKFSGSLGGAVENLGTFATKLGTSTAALGALAVATVVLVEAVGNLNETMDKMGVAQDNAQAAAATLGDQVQVLIEGGMSLDEAMAQVGDKVDGATDKFNNARIVGVIPLSNAFNAGSEFTKTMAEAQESLQGVLVANTASHAQYVEQVIAYNQTLDEGTKKLRIMSEAEYEAAQRRAEGINLFTGVTEAIIRQSEAINSQSQAMADAEPAWMSTQRVEKSFHQLQEQGTQRMRERERVLGDLNQSTEKSSAIMDEAARAAENRAAIEEKAARVEEMQAVSAAAAAAALEEKRQKDNDVAMAEADLATKVMGASKAMIAQTFISGLDPEKMGLIAYQEAVENIQLSFGLATPESIALARGITKGVEAANEGKIPYADLDAFVSDLITDAQDGEVTFDKYAGAMQDSDEAAGRLTRKSALLGEDLAGLQEDANIGVEGIDEATTAMGELDSAMSETAGAAPGYGSAIGSGLRSGMEPEMDGFVASFRGKLQEIRNALPMSEPKDRTSPLYGLPKSGEAIIHNLNQGIEAAGPSAVATMNSIGAAMGEALTSAAHEGASELFDIAGVLGGLGGAAGGMLQRQTVDPLQAQLDGVNESLDEMQGQFEAVREERLALQEGMDAWQIARLERLATTDPLQLDEEELALARRLIALRNQENNIAGVMLNLRQEQLTVGEELAEQQARLNRLQQQQENLRFLEQQMALLDLIAEKGLDAEAVLGGLQLGLDANLEDVVDAMTRAMEQIIAQAEEELGIASPSKVFENIGAQAMQGMAMGIEKLMSLPVAQSAIATQAMVATPAAIVSPRNTTIDNSRTVGDINITAPGSGTGGNAQLIATIRQVVREEVRGT